MPEIRMRQKNQLTLPASVARAAHIEADDRLTVDFVNGVVIITPKKAPEQKRDLMSYVGSGRGLWGNTPAEVDQEIRNLRNSWER